MNVIRSLLLAASQSRWMREHATRCRFVQRTVNRFMPGEKLEDALAAADSLRTKRIGTVFTHLGENIKEEAEAEQVAAHYVGLLRQIHEHNLGAEVSVKLTQLGLDLSGGLCFEKLKKIAQHENKDSTVWIDMEASNYVDATLEIYARELREFPNVGICLQAYLYRTKEDLDKLLPLRPSVRLVKGAYKEPANVAFPRKRDVDENYFELAKRMLRAKREGKLMRTAFGTHDPVLVRRIADFAESEGFDKTDLEFQMLYGIQRAEQERLTQEGYQSKVLVSYGDYWYPWFVRRLAERPANLWFVLRNIFAK